MKNTRMLADSNYPLVMGILNATPDSFYDGAKYQNIETALQQVSRMIDSEVDIIDVGGESTRPGATPIGVEEETKRVVPLIMAIRNLSGDVCISIDTTKSEVAHKAIKAGASIINDVSGLRNDPDMVETARKFETYIIVMHMKGNPENMQDDPVYEKWVVDEINDFFEERIDFVLRHGIDRKKIILDPGIGFGKTVEHNLQILANCDKFKKFGLPLLIAPSNKSFIGNILKVDPDNRIWGTAAAISYIIANGADIVRVHDVPEMKMVTTLVTEIVKCKQG